MALYAAAAGTSIDDLQPLGTAADIGGTILAGDADIYGKPVFGAPTDPVHSGYFGVTQSEFTMVYPFHEHATVVLGEVTLTDELSGERHTYRAGDSWVVEKGTSVRWNVTSNAFVKHYIAAA